LISQSVYKIGKCMNAQMEIKEKDIRNKIIRYILYIQQKDIRQRQKKGIL